MPTVLHGCWTFPSSPPFSIYNSNNNTKNTAISISSSSSSLSWSFSLASRKCKTSSVAQFPSTLKQCHGRLDHANSTHFRISCSEAKDPEVVDCVGSGLDVECVASQKGKEEIAKTDEDNPWIWLEWAVLVSPFFFWGTAMVAMKEVLSKAGPFFVAAFRLIPAGLLLVAFAKSKDRPLPSGLTAWLSIVLFALVDAACFQVFAFLSVFIYFSFQSRENIVLVYILKFSLW